MGIEHFSFRRGLIALVFLFCIFVFLPARANAGFSLGDAANFAVIYTGSGSHNLAINNGTVDGNIGLGDPFGATPQAQLNSPLTINGNIEFAGSVNDSIGSGVIVNGSITASNANVETDLLALNALSATLSNEAGFSVAISIANNQTQTVSAATGTLDGTGNRVFTLTSMSFVNGSTLIIDGNGAGNSVVFNIDFAPSFGGKILLTGGLTSDQVLFNVVGGSTTTLSGGHTLTISASSSSSGDTETGTFLDPNGAIQMNNTILLGRLFGGDMHDEMIVSGASIFAPVPEPSSYALVMVGILGVVASVRRRKR